MTVSYWRRSGGEKRELACDVCVIGAGVMGVSAAMHLERLGQRVVVLERHHLASGASSRNAGFLMRGAADNYLVARQEWGPELARLVWRLTEENLAALRAAGIESLPTYRRIPSALLGTEPIETAELRQSAELLRADGFDADWLEPGDPRWTDTIARRGHALGALVNPHDGAVNSWDLLRLLAAKLRGPLVEGQEVFAIEPDPLRVRAGDVAVACRRVLVCTNAYVPLLMPQLARLVLPRRGQMLAISAPGLRLDFSYYANRGYEYFRQHTDGTIVVGGCRKQHADDEVGYEDRTTEPVQRDLAEFAARALGLDPSALNITARWSGVMGFTPDGLPIVGPIDGPWPARAVWFAGGCTGHGMSLFHRVAELAVRDMIAGETSPFRAERFSDTPVARDARSNMV